MSCDFPDWRCVRGGLGIRYEFPLDMCTKPCGRNSMW